MTYVRVPQRKSPRNHQSDHPARWVAVPNQPSDESSSSDTSEDDSAGIFLKQETDDSDSDDRDAQPLAEAFGMGSGDAATATGIELARLHGRALDSAHHVVWLERHPRLLPSERGVLPPPDGGSSTSPDRRGFERRTPTRAATPVFAFLFRVVVG